MFPKTIFVKQWQEKYGVDKAFTKQLAVVNGELLEAQDAYSRGDFKHSREEVIDALHSAVQLFYMLPDHKFEEISRIIEEVKSKNLKRGYYE